VPVSFFFEGFDGTASTEVSGPVDMPISCRTRRLSNSCAPTMPFPKTSAGACSIWPAFSVRPPDRRPHLTRLPRRATARWREARRGAADDGDPSP
jgi:hypothetical protein